jgi:hypothetical protein
MNAVFSKELVPDFANELATLILPEDVNDLLQVQLGTFQGDPIGGTEPDQPSTPRGS